MTPETLADDVIAFPGGRARIRTSRPGPGTDWTITVDAPGIDADGKYHTTDSGSVARMMHDAYVDICREQIDAIPVLHFPHPQQGYDTYDPDDREPYNPYWTEDR